MFIAISDVDHEVMLDNCDVERWNYYHGCEMENPVFMAMTFEQACECISRYYYSLDSGDDSYPDYAIYEINDGSWTVKCKHTVTINVDRHDASQAF